MHFDVGHVAALSKPSIWCEAQRIVNEEGFRAFWKGNLVTIAHRLPYSAVNFYAYERYKNVSPGALCSLHNVYVVQNLLLMFLKFESVSLCLCCVAAITFTRGGES